MVWTYSLGFIGADALAIGLPVLTVAGLFLVVLMLNMVALMSRDKALNLNTGLLLLPLVLLSFLLFPWGAGSLLLAALCAGNLTEAWRLSTKRPSLGRIWAGCGAVLLLTATAGLLYAAWLEQVGYVVHPGRIPMAISTGSGPYCIAITVLLAAGAALAFRRVWALWLAGAGLLGMAVVAYRMTGISLVTLALAWLAVGNLAGALLVRRGRQSMQRWAAGWLVAGAAGGLWLPIPWLPEGHHMTGLDGIHTVVVQAHDGRFVPDRIEVEPDRTVRMIVYHTDLVRTEGEWVGPSHILEVRSFPHYPANFPTHRLTNVVIWRSSSRRVATTEFLPIEEGTYPFRCRVHPEMVGTIEVRMR